MGRRGERAESATSARIDGSESLVLPPSRAGHGRALGGVVGRALAIAMALRCIDASMSFGWAVARLAPRGGVLAPTMPSMAQAERSERRRSANEPELRAPQVKKIAAPSPPPPPLDRSELLHCGEVAVELHLWLRLDTRVRTPRLALL